MLLLPLMEDFEEFGNDLGITIESKFSKVKSYLDSKDDTMSSFYINSQSDDIFEENFM